MVVVAALVGLALWYLIYGMECAINGGTLGRNPYTMHFSLLWEEILWLLPVYGKRRREQFIKDQMGDFENGMMFSGSQSFTYKEIREKGNYDEVARSMLPGLPHFLFMHVFIPSIPVLIYFGTKLTR